MAGSSGEPSMVLEHHTGSRPWQRMVLSRERHALCLMDETGSILAEASTLPALLDAVDGGVAEPVQRSPVLLHGAAVLATACAAGLVSAVVL